MNMQAPSCIRLHFPQFQWHLANLSLKIFLEITHCPSGIVLSGNILVCPTQDTIIHYSVDTVCPLVPTAQREIVRVVRPFNM